MKFYVGEVRSWPTSHQDRWRGMDALSTDLAYWTTVTTLGHSFRATKVAATVNERQAAGGASHDPTFSAPHQLWRAEGCDPDLDNAISTLAVWDKDKTHICVREHHGVTISEVFEYFCETLDYRTLLDEWLKGTILIRGKPPRGTNGGRTRRQ